MSILDKIRAELSKMKSKIPLKRWIGFFGVGLMMASLPTCIMIEAHFMMTPLLLVLYIIVTLAALFVIPIYGMHSLLMILEQQEKEWGRETTLADWKRR